MATSHKIAMPPTMLAFLIFFSSLFSHFFYFSFQFPSNQTKNKKSLNIRNVDKSNKEILMNQIETH